MVIAFNAFHGIVLPPEEDYQTALLAFMVRYGTPDIYMNRDTKEYRARLQVTGIGWVHGTDCPTVVEALTLLESKLIMLKNAGRDVRSHSERQRP